MAELELTPAARDDLSEIDSHGAAEFGKHAADRYARGLRRAFDQLARFPHSAPARPDFGEGIRCRAYRSHLILHLVEGNSVLVVRILHHSRDVSQALQR